MLVVTTWPVWARKDVHQLNAAFRRQAPDFFRQQGIDFFDAGPELARQIEGRREKYEIPDDGHPSEAGAELIAATIWPWLGPRLRHP